MTGFLTFFRKSACKGISGFLFFEKKLKTVYHRKKSKSMQPFCDGYNRPPKKQSRKPSWMLHDAG